MASNLAFELEDQTDEDFFDKLVNDDDDDDDDVGSSLKSTELMKGQDILDGDESDEVKAFANLSIGEVSNVIDGLETKGMMGSHDSVVPQSVQARDPQVRNGEANSSLVSSDSLSFDDGQVSEDGGMASKANSALRRESSGSLTGGVKEVQWSAFTDSADHASGFGSFSDFFTELGDEAMGNFQNEAKAVPENEASKNAITGSPYSHAQYQGESGTIAEQSVNGEYTNSVQYWEGLNSEWKYDPNIGQWYQLDNSHGTANGLGNLNATVGNMQDNFDLQGVSGWAISDVQSAQVSYAQQTAQSAVGTVRQFSTTDSMSGFNISQQNGEYQYPAHMVFDPLYPGWYYDTIAQNWFSLAAYHASVQSTDQTHYPQAQNAFLSAGSNFQGVSQGNDSDGLQNLSNDGINQSWASSFGGYDQQGTHAWQSEVGTETRSSVNSSVGHSWQSSYDSNFHSNSEVDQQKSSDLGGTVASYNKTHQSYDNSSWGGSVHSFVPADIAFQQFNHAPQVQQNGPVQYPTDYCSSTTSVSQPLFPNGHHVSYAPSEGRSSAGRPPHALVTFGFGGKLLVMKDNSSAGFSLLGSKDMDRRFLSVFNLMEVVGVTNSPSGTGTSASSYLYSLCHQSFPGPLVGGNAGSKELNKWIDERTTNSESLDMNYNRGEASKLLLSLLKIAYQHYGKLRSFGVDTGLKENDLPETAVAKLFASAKRNGFQSGEYSAISKCLMTLPSEANIQITATEVQNLLISGRKKEALQRAQDGQFWGFALILARELGDQFYAETVKQMAVSQLVIGSPLRTLCLLIAKKPEEVFSNNVIPAGYLPGAMHMSPQPVQSAANSMLDNWEENLAVITANRTENDHLVIIHLGDCLWKEKSDVTAAHVCYLVAEADFELYSDSARLCLIGADHLNFPRTYASPEAIQRTELFEYAKVLGNSQFVLLPLQPYKLVYAHMLAEVGRVSDSLKYCQAVYKSLKTGRSPEADTLKQLLSSLEERIKTHQQSGYAANLAPTKIVGKLLNFFDNTAHRVVGGLPPPVPSTSQGSVQGNGHHFQTPGNGHHFPTPDFKLTSSQSTMGMSPLTPSASMEPISQWAVDGSKMTLQSRSISEPDIGRTSRPDQVDSSKEAISSAEAKQSSSTGTSRFGRLNFGAQILQKTVGLVLKPRQGRQAKLGDTNKFYYDEKLKRWVEEGAEPPAEESALPPPPPTVAAFQSGKSDYNLNNALNNGLRAADSSPESSSSTPPGGSPGIPAIPPSSNQFSARGRMGVRSRYVDTFNKGGGASTNLFQAPSIPSAKPSSLASAKFFIPTAAPSNEQAVGTEGRSKDEISESRESSSKSMNDPFQNLAPLPAATMQRFPSVDNIRAKGTTGNENTSLAPQSRRTSSWSAIHSNSFTPPPTTEVKASPLSFTPSDQSSGSLHLNGGNFGDDLQEVEL